MQSGPLQRWEVDAVHDMLHRNGDMTIDQAIKFVQQRQDLRHQMPQHHSPTSPSTVTQARPDKMIQGPVRSASRI